MPKTKISEYSTTNSSNTDIESINIDEGCPPSSINNAIRELMVHLKEFQTGSSGDPLTVAGGMFISGGGSANTLTVTGILTASGGTILSSTNTLSGSNIISGNINSSGTTNTFSGGNILSGTNTFSGTNIFSSDVTLNAQSDLRFADSDSSNWVAFQSPATVASNVTWTLPATDGTSNQVLATNGSGTLSWATAGGGASISAGDSKVEVTDTGSDGTIVFNTDGSERMRVTSAGDVGIGNSTARGKLTVSDGTVNTAGEGVYQAYVVGADRSALTEGNLTVQSNDALAINKGGSIAFGGRAVSASTAGANWAKIAGLKENATTAEYGGYLQFSTRPNSGAAAERARITSGGDLLVGTTSNLGPSGSAKRLVVSETSSGGQLAAFISGYTLGAQTHVEIKTNFNGSDGIGFYNAASTKVGSITINSAATAYNTSSDYRLKNTITPMTGALDKVALLKPCTYKWNADGSDGEGFIAHELAEVVPHCVTGEKDAVDADGNPQYQGIDTSFLVATLTAAIQELKAELDTVKAQNAAFEARLAALEAN